MLPSHLLKKVDENFPLQPAGHSTCRLFLRTKYTHPAKRWHGQNKKQAEIDLLFCIYYKFLLLFTKALVSSLFGVSNTCCGVPSSSILPFAMKITLSDTL